MNEDPPPPCSCVAGARCPGRGRRSELDVLLLPWDPSRVGLGSIPGYRACSRERGPVPTHLLGALSLLLGPEVLCNGRVGKYPQKAQPSWWPSQECQQVWLEPLLPFFGTRQCPRTQPGSWELVIYKKELGRMSLLGCLSPLGLLPESHVLLAQNGNRGRD